MIASPSPFQTGVMGDFVLERELGRGGMGVVYAAVQKSMGRPVALKVLPTFAGLDPDAVARFRREAEAAGRLSHPGIVPIYGVGEQDGVHYFAMELVAGPPLSRLLDPLSIRRPERLRGAFVEEAGIADDFPSLRQVPGEASVCNRYLRSCVAMIAEVASALAAAHRQRVIHRDVKPSNILLHPEGRPVLVDFGLARDERSNSLTRSGDQIGTPSYMSPEQVRGRRDLDARADVYGLGAVLYELLTLRAPFESASSADTMRMILEQEPTPARQRNPQIPVDLATIVHTCLAKDPDDRYPVMEALELDLRSFLAGRRIMARAPSVWIRLSGSMRRHRKSAVVAAGAFLVAGLVAFSAGIVGDSRSVYRGREALAEARSELVDFARPDRARDLYGQAAALLKDPSAVREARVADFRAAFDEHYPERLEVLRAFVSALSDPERNRLEDLLARIEGRGSLGFHSRRLAQRVEGMWVKGLQDGELEPQWRPVAVGQPLPMGEYLVRLEIEGSEPVVEWARVLRDRQTELRPNPVRTGQLPRDTVQITDPKSYRTFAVARFETTRAEYKEFLEELDADYRSEMTPLGWDGGETRPEHPVRGLSYHQARAWAAHRGAHLPTVREHWLAASAGLQQLRYPWGKSFDATALVADPLHLEETEVVHSRPRGGSPLGVLHLLGNAAEIAAREDRERPVMLGGHFHWERPRDLVLVDETVPMAPLDSAIQPNPYAGVRRYHFLPAREDPAIRERAKERRAEVRLVARGSVFHDWVIGRDGRLRYSLELNGIHDGNDVTRVPLGTFGFVQQPQTLSMRDGHGRPVAFDQVVAPDGESTAASVRLPGGLLPGQGYRLHFECDLMPTSGLVPVGDAYELSIPIKGNLRLGALHSVRLPAGTRVEGSRPAPTFHYTQDGGQVLMWETSRQDRIASAVVRFRVDGMLGEKWAFRSEVEPVILALLSAWNRRDAALHELLDPAFAHLPGGLGVHALDAPGQLPHRYRDPVLVDVMAFGDIVSVDVTADWEILGRDGHELLLQDWPLLVQLRRTDRGPIGLRMMPRSRSDQGRYTVDGGYRNARLRAGIRKQPGVVISRTQDAWTEMQVKLLSVDEERLSVRVLGHYAPEGESEERVRFRLTGGEMALRPGERLVHDRSREAGDRTLHWMFPDHEGAWSREAWTFLTRGRRHFLIRASVRAATRAAADERFASREAQEFFDRAAAALVIE